MPAIQLGNNQDPYTTVVDEDTRAQNIGISENLERYLEETANNNGSLFIRNETQPLRSSSDTRFEIFVGQNETNPIVNSENQPTGVTRATGYRPLSHGLARVTGYRLPSQESSSEEFSTNTQTSFDITQTSFDISDLFHRLFVNNSVSKNITKKPLAFLVSVILYVATAALTMIAVNYGIALYSGLEITKAILLTPILASSISSAIATVALACCILGKSRILLEQEARLEGQRQVQQRLQERREHQRDEPNRRVQAQQNFDLNRLNNDSMEQALRDRQESMSDCKVPSAKD